MDEPRLFETHGAVERLTVTLYRDHGAWSVMINSRREGDAQLWSREVYSELSWGELLDVLTASALA